MEKFIKKFSEYGIYYLSPSDPWNDCCVVNTEKVLDSSTLFNIANMIGDGTEEYYSIMNTVKDNFKNIILEKAKEDNIPIILDHKYARKLCLFDEKFIEHVKDITEDIINEMNKLEKGV